MFCFTCFSDFPACISVEHKPAVPMKDRKSVGSCRTRVKDACELPWGCREFNWSHWKNSQCPSLLSLSLKYLLIIQGTQQQFYMTK